MTDEMHKYVRLICEIEVEVIEPVGVRAGALVGSPEDMGTTGDLLGGGAFGRDVDVATVATQAVFPPDAWPGIQERLRKVGLRHLGGGNFVPRVRKPDDPDAYEAYPEGFVKRNDGTVRGIDD